MPPYVPRKRLRSPSSQPSPPAKKRAIPTHKAKPTVFDTYDAEHKASSSAAETKAFIDALSSEESSLSEIDSDEFEDVVQPAKRRKVAQEADSDEELEFEDVEAEEELRIPDITADLNITVRAPGDMEYRRLELKPGQKPVATKKMREARIRAHCMHVQFLMWHNVVRNSWANDREVQELLVKSLSEGLKAEVKRWKIAMGYESTPKKKLKGKQRMRDWGADAERAEEGGVNMSQGDPIIRLLKYLTAYWKKRFRVTAPGLRKLGYRDPKAMREEMDAWNEGPQDPGRHGEIVTDVEEFGELARKGTGSRDVGAQLFTALLRGLGIEARMVASLQPTGFGWTKGEEANARKKATSDTTGITKTDMPNGKSKSDVKKKKSKAPPVSQNSDDSVPSSPPSSDAEDIPVSTNISPSKGSPKRYDKDLLYPIYWTEVLSPVSNTYIPISTLINPNVVTSPDQYFNFEPRGAAAEKAKQVMSYVIAFSSDGTAKDVTIRYLRKRVWPGKTKGFRIPIEKIPVHNRHGKVLKYEEYDWFKRVMRGYARPGSKTTIADQIEDEGDLIPVKPEKDTKKNAVPETLQGYKQSATFVLERHLRREEALLPTAKAVKQFSVGKGEKTVSEPVYHRSDVVTCKTSESWHKEGRQVKLGEKALKQVPIRAVTLIRKREIEDEIRETGEKPTQGLFAEEQTEWIIPDPIGEDGVIPRNVFGNIDVYVPTMVPRGAVHVKLKGTAKVCRKVGIQYAEACTGFEFGKQRAVPVLTGVVVAEENEGMVRDAWEEEEKIRMEKEGKKRSEVAVGLWKRFLRGLRVRSRLVREYGIDDVEDGDGQEWARKAGGRFGMGESGGFLRDGEDEAEHGGGFFIESEDEGGADFEIVGDSQGKKKVPRGTDRNGNQLATPTSLQARHADIPEDEEGLSELSEPPAEEDDAGGFIPERKVKVTTNGRAKAQPPKRKASRKPPKEAIIDEDLSNNKEDESGGFVPQGKAKAQTHKGNQKPPPSTRKAPRKSVKEEDLLDEETSGGKDQEEHEDDESEDFVPRKKTKKAKTNGKVVTERRSTRKSGATSSPYFKN